MHKTFTQTVNSTPGRLLAGALCILFFAPFRTLAVIPEVSLVNELRQLAVAENPDPGAWQAFYEKVKQVKPAMATAAEENLRLLDASLQALNNFPAATHNRKLIADLLQALDLPAKASEKLLAEELDQLLAWETGFMLRSPQLVENIAGIIESASSKVPGEIITAAYQSLLETRRENLTEVIDLVKAEFTGKLTAQNTGNGNKVKADAMSVGTSRQLVLSAFGADSKAAGGDDGTPADALLDNRIYWGDYMAKRTGGPENAMLNLRLDAVDRLAKLMAALARLPETGTNLPPQNLSSFIPQLWNQAATEPVRAGTQQALLQLQDSGLQEFLKNQAGTAGGGLNEELRAEISKILSIRGLAFETQAALDRFVMVIFKFLTPAAAATIRPDNQSLINWRVYIGGAKNILSQTAAFESKRSAKAVADIGPLDELLAAMGIIKLMNDIPEAEDSPALLRKLLNARVAAAVGALEWAVAVDKKLAQDAIEANSILTELKRQPLQAD